MPHDPIRPPKRVLDPDERISEALFGLIMVITFTGSLSVAEAGRDDVRVMLIGALGCNLAWGIIDGVIYLMGCLAERGRSTKALHALRRAPDAEAAERVIADALPPLVASVLRPAEYESIAERLRGLPEPPAVPTLRRDDFLGAIAVFLIVFLATFPVAIPFLLMREAVPALRVSNAIAIVMLFGLGFAFGRAVGWNRWLVAIAMVVLGSALAFLTMALGG